MATSPRSVASRRRLAETLPWLEQRREARLRVSIAAAGGTPVTLIAATAFGISDLRTLATHVLLPVIVAASFVMSIDRRISRLLPIAVASGLAATLLYDSFRFAFLALGLMHGDPIPHIGVALNLHPAWLVGYVWRYFGNGTGLALAFLALGLRGVRAGVNYGLVVCSGLLVTLAVSPYGQQMLFALTPTTVVMAVGGHIIYGAVLGWFVNRLTPRPLHLVEARTTVEEAPVPAPAATEALVG